MKRAWVAIVAAAGVSCGLAGCSSTNSPVSAAQVTNAKSSVKQINTFAKATPKQRRHGIYHTFEAGPGTATTSNTSQQYQPPAGWAGLFSALSAPKQ